MPNPSPPLVSVLIRSMDRPELDNALQSVATQTYPNIEYIVIDGNSTDGTQDIVQGFGKKVSIW